MSEPAAAVRPGAAATRGGELIALSFLAFLAVSVLAFSRNYANIAYGLDGASSFGLAIHAWKWAPSIVGFSTDPLQAMSDLWSGENAFLMPAHALYALFFGKPEVFTPEYAILAYTVFASELFLSVLVLARALGMEWPLCIIPAWILPLLAHPYFGYSLLFPILMTAPSIGTTMSECALLLAAVAGLGRGWRDGSKHALRSDAARFLAILLLLFLLVTAHPFRTILWVPALCCVSLGLVFGAEAGQRLPKFLMLAACSVIVLASGGGLFLLGMFSFTTPRFWAGALQNNVTDPTTISIWYGAPSIGPLGPQLFGFGVFGMVTALLFGSRLLRGCAASLLLFVTAFFALGFVALEYRNWRGPAPLYFEILIWPFYAIFGVWGVAYWGSRVFELAGRAVGKLRTKTGRGTPHRPRAGWRAARAVDAMLLFFLVALPGYAFNRALSVDNPYRLQAFPPRLSPMIQYLRDEAGLTPGGPFRGRVVGMELVQRPEGLAWVDFVNVLATRYIESGSDYVSSGLWYYDVPTLFEYSAATSPAFFRTVTALLARPEDQQTRNVVMLRRPDARALALLGVRFVIVTDTLPPPFRLVRTERTYGSEVLSLYEVPDVNLGTNAPARVTLVHGFDEALARLGAGDFDFAREIVVFDPSLARETLSPVDSAGVSVIRGGFRVEAKSRGRSLLVLPFEFSRCLEADTGPDNAGAPRLIRVNAVETGVLFERQVDASIRYLTSPFHDPGCRLQDSRDFTELLDRR